MPSFIKDIPLNNKTLIKIKKRISNEIGEIHHSRSDVFTNHCYAEWRISYEGDSELKSILTHLYSNDIINNQTIANLISLIKNNNVFLENHLIYESRNTQNNITSLGLEYTEIDNVHSSLFLNKPEYADSYIELCQLKQGIVNGYQPFLHICIPLTNLEVLNNNPPLLGRIAMKNENTTFKIDSNNFQIIIDAIITFGAINSTYKNDMLTLLNSVLVTAQTP